MRTIAKVTLGIGIFAIAGAAMAADTNTIGTIATTAEASIKSIKSLILNLFYLAGLFLFGSGLFLLYKDQKQPNQGHAKNGAIAAFVGVAMLLIPTLVNYFSGTMGVGGTDTASTALKAEKAF